MQRGGWGQPTEVRVNRPHFSSGIMVRSEQEPRAMRSVLLRTVCGKKSHTLIRFIRTRVLEVEPIAFGHAIQAAAIDPKDLGGAFFIPLSGT
jgi:hypothetical protein